MSIQKLDNKIVTSEIKQTSNRMTIPFRDSAIDKIKNTELTFGKKRHLIIAFDVPKESSLKGYKDCLLDFKYLRKGLEEN